MATKQQSVIADLSQGYVRGDVRVGIDQASAIRARLLLAFFEKYYPQYYTKEYALFRERIRLSGIQETPEDDRYTEELLAFVQSFEQSHPDVEQQLQVVAPKEMVKLASEGMAEDIKARRAEIQLRAHELVKTYALRLNSAEQQGLEDDLVKTLSSSTSSAQTPQELRAVLEKELTQILTTNPDTKNKFSDETVRGQAVKESVRRVVDADPTAAQRILFSDVNSGELIFQQVSAADPPLWQPYVAAINNLPMADKETREEFITRALDVTKTTAVLSSDLWQAPAVRVGPSDLISAILEARGNKGALITNAAAITIVSKSWVAAVEAITQRAGGTVTGALEEIIKQGNAQWDAHSGEPLGRAGSAVAGLLGEILTPAFINYVDAQSLLQKLGGQDGNRVATFIKSLPAAQHDEGAASAALFLAITTTWRPGDLQFKWQEAQDGGGLGAWAVHVAKDSVLEKLFSKFVKSKTVEAAGGVVKKGGASLVAGFLTKLGLSATADVVLAMIGTPVATAIKWVIQGAIWFGGYIWRPISNFLGKLTRGEIAQLGAAQNAIKQTLDSWLGPRPPAAPKQWYEQEWVVIALVICTAVFLPMFFAIMQITARDSALFVAGQENQPEGFQGFDQTYSPPEYLDFSALASKEFSCLSYGEGFNSGAGQSVRLGSNDVQRIEDSVDKYPQLKLLSCGIGCPDRKINITKFTNLSSYGGFAPSARPGNVILYGHTFTKYDDQTFAYLLAHELAHQLDWFNSPIATGFEALGCGSAPPSTYHYTGNSAEVFAESTALYLIGHPEIQTYCDGKAFTYLNQSFSQCR